MGQASGLGAGALTRLMATLAPVVLGALGESRALPLDSRRWSFGAASAFTTRALGDAEPTGPSWREYAGANGVLLRQGHVAGGRGAVLHEE
jgi:hypothetical protein